MRHGNSHQNVVYIFLLYTLNLKFVFFHYFKECIEICFEYCSFMREHFWFAIWIKCIIIMINIPPPLFSVALYYDDTVCVCYKENIQIRPIWIIVGARVTNAKASFLLVLVVVRAIARAAHHHIYNSIHYCKRSEVLCI